MKKFVSCLRQLLKGTLRRFSTHVSTNVFQNVTAIKIKEVRNLAPVFRKADSTIHWINITIQWIVQLVFVILIRWIAIYPVDSAIQLLNNRGQNTEHVQAKTRTFNRRNSSETPLHPRHPTGKGLLSDTIQTGILSHTS